MIQTVIFDMDGVIIDSEHLHKEVEQEMFEELGITLSEDDHNKFVGTSSKNMWQTLIAAHGLTSSVEDLVDEGRKRYQAKLSLLPDIKPIDGVVELMQALKQADLTMVLASSSQVENIELVVSLFKIKPFFKGVISGATMPHSKPHPLIFLEAAKLAATSPENCLVIEDSSNGVTAAKAAGMKCMKCIGYRNLNSGFQDLSAADLVVDSFVGLEPDLIRSL